MIENYLVHDVACSNCVVLFALQIDTKLVQCFADQIFKTGFVHADPHPGNSKFFLGHFILVLEARERKLKVLVAHRLVLKAILLGFIGIL